MSSNFGFMMVVAGLVHLGLVGGVYIGTGEAEASAGTNAGAEQPAAPSTQPASSASPTPSLGEPATSSPTPPRGSTSRATTNPTQPSPANHGRHAVHVVKKNEYLSTIATRYGVTVKKIMEANGLRSSQIMIGQNLKIPLD